MTVQSFTTAFSVDQTPKQVFDAITNVRGWWSGNIEDGTAKLGDEFTYRYQDVQHSKQRLVEVVPDQKVVWLVLDSYLSFPKDKTEWNGTKVIFEIGRKGNNTFASPIRVSRPTMSALTNARAPGVSILTTASGA
jgi:hypothetical protein